MKIFKILCVILFVSVKEVIFCEEEATATINDVICSVCYCNVTEIDCSERDLHAPFTVDDWKSVATLQPAQVNLSHNPLGAFTRLPPLPVQTLDLSWCELTTLGDGSFMQLEEIVWLDLSHNKLTTSKITRRVFVGKISFQRPFKPFTNIRYLSLANNHIHSLAQDVFNFMTELTTLDLSGNPLAFIDQVTMAAISDLTNLKEIYLSGCELESLPEGLLRRQRRIQRLDISDNKFTIIPAVLVEATNLVFLNIGRNPITSIEAPNAIANLTKLRHLQLCRLSKLQRVGANSLGGLENLEILDMSYNPRLTVLDPTFLVWREEEHEKWPLLKELYLNNNNISTLDSHTLSPWDRLRVLDVTNNPYLCDCKLTWMVHTLVPILDLMINNSSQANNMICKSPEDLKGLTFRYLYESQKTLMCRQSENLVNASDADGVILLGVMIGVFVTFPLVLVITLLWKKGFFTKCKGTLDNGHLYEEAVDEL